MNRTRLSLFFLAGFLSAAAFLAVGKQVLAQTEKKPAEPPKSGKPTPTTGGVGFAPVYKPPLRGAPSGRVGGGTRGGPSGTDHPLVLSVLTPDHVGLTTQEQPSLYWYTSQPTTYPIELTVTENEAVNPMIEKRIGSPSQAGIQQIRLVDYGVRLKTGSVYRWYIAVVPDPDVRSKDILAGGSIERIEPTEALRARLSHASKAELPSVYAEQGIWYDALSAISDMIDADPSNASLHAERAALLEQVRLQEAAAFDRSAAR